MELDFYEPTLLNVHPPLSIQHDITSIIGIDIQVQKAITNCDNLPAVVKLKKNALSFVLRFLLEMLAMAGKWTPWQAPRKTLDKRITRKALV